MAKKKNYTIIGLIKKYWFIPVLIVAISGYLLKKKKVEPQDKSENAQKLLSESGVKDEIRQNYYTSITSQIASALGTSFPWYHYKFYTENEAKVYELLKDISTTEFKVISELYFKSYAKGRNLSDDLAKLLDDRYYNLLKVK